MLQRLLLLKLLLGLMLNQYGGTQYAAAQSHTNSSGTAATVVLHIINKYYIVTEKIEFQLTN